MYLRHHKRSALKFQTMAMDPSATACLLFSLLLLSGLANSNLEGDALIAQKNAWEDPYLVLKSWNNTDNDTTPCSWFHVTCNNNDSVVRIDLGLAGLSGPLVPQLGVLQNLQYLELFGNMINGTLPSELGNLTNLVSLGLGGNQLVGNIPSSFANMRSLISMRLDKNMLSGTVPADVVYSLIFNGELSLMNISGNDFDGTNGTHSIIGAETINIIKDRKSSS